MAADEDDDDGGFVAVKCAWSRLGCAPALRERVDDVLSRVHYIAVRGSHVANSIAVDAMNSSDLDAVCKVVFQQTWWYAVYAACGEAGKSGKVDADPRIRPTAARLFGAAQPVSTSRLSPFMSYLARDAVANVRTLVTLNFAAQVEKAFLREVRLWELLHAACVLPAPAPAKEAERARRAIATWAARECLEHERPTSFPENSPAPLKAELQALIASWSAGHRQLLPCPTPEFAANKRKACGLYRWMLELQVHRADCLARATCYCGGNSDEARKALGGAGKALRALPLASRHMKHVALDKSGLRELLLTMDGVDPDTVPSVRPGPGDYVSTKEQARQAQKREKWLEKHPEERDKPRRARVARSKESADRETEKFWSHFPGAGKLLRQAEKQKGATLHPLLRTDGVAVTVLVSKPWLPKKPRTARAVADLDAGNPPPLRPQPGQRLVSIDPGRRSMIYAYVEDHGPDGAVAARYTYDVSTRQMAREARVKRTAAVSVATLKSSYVPLGDGGAEAKHVTLLAALERLPDSRAYESWHAYESAAVPLLDPAIAALQRKALRRAKLDGYRARDAAIDRVCLALCRGLPQRPPAQGAPSAELAAPAAAAVGRLPCIQHPPKRPSKRNFRSTDPALPLLAAFGDGRACSSGLGYCPAPQGRLRHHLARKHHAHVCLIGEYRTSMTCSCCGNVLQDVHPCKTDGRVRRPRNEKSVLWAVKKCRDALPALTRRGLERWRTELL